ncbi:MAG: squalene synthase HpnD [Rhodospirillaceae bacterium]|nr:MAG: squalene synthase HpnD [Rhodospirillaceae bacterium]
MGSFTRVSSNAENTLNASGSSFYWALKLLPARKREAMFRVYAFCRVVDDIADGDDPAAQKMQDLEVHRKAVEILFSGGKPVPACVEDLRCVMDHFDVEKDDLLAVIDGMEMDAYDTVTMKDEATFDLYIDRVASAVGRLSDKVFGISGPDADQLAYHLGRALQITNILRDIEEDAERGRLYLPADLLAAHGASGDSPQAVMQNPNLGAALDVLAARAHNHYDQARDALSRLDRSATRPARMMQAVYSRVLEGLEMRGLANVHIPVKFSKFKKLWLALRYGVFG